MHVIRITHWRRKCTAKAASLTILLVKSWNVITCKMWSRKCQTNCVISTWNIYDDPRQAHLVPFEERNVMPTCRNIKVNTRACKKFFSYYEKLFNIEQQPALQLKITIQKEYFQMKNLISENVVYQPINPKNNNPLWNLWKPTEAIYPTTLIRIVMCCW